MRQVQIGPSLLTADFLRLGEEVAAAEAAGVDFMHLDVMDGHFVPNITFGPLVVDAVRKATSLPLDVHLMIDEPERYIDQFAAAGADTITIHVETCVHLHAALSRIRELGVETGLSLNPLTPLEDICEAIPLVDVVLVMSVNPGFGGQTFIPGALKRIEALRQTLDQSGGRTRLEVDGGIKASNVARVVEAGADMIVVGSAVYRPDVDVATAVQELRAGVTES